ncbi:uncharacterized protein TNIN_142011 [Trichonephila inaurata madagascariensis]|uniref:Uncharacterized protein n=1 Tax=Trichonephila inaurata madagascariensis TaxID=2747483 RepID=A0A8X6XL59_9ARAC|nr:uncharacterized protein TNIN_142011 [Trichonephila inaurata madagascariensis]
MSLPKCKWLKIEVSLRKRVKEATEENQRLKSLCNPKDLKPSFSEGIKSGRWKYGEDDSCITSGWEAARLERTGVQNHYNKRSNLNNNSHFRNWVFAPRKPSVAVSSATDIVGGAKLVNGHLCWKGTSKLSNSNCHLSVSEDISSICTEFDPLSDDNPSCENFVDSLNLSIPLKPTQVAISQLSSIGDSLHSNSLDNGCSSSPVIYQNTRKVSNARSVDGIRELLLENGYCKKLSPPQYGQSSVAPVVLQKSGRHLPVNIMNCMHERSDYSLL